MKTTVLMKRVLFDCEIEQNNQNEFFSATDLLKAGNKWRVSQGLDFLKFEDWKNKTSTKDFIKQLEAETNQKVIISGRGRGHHTWVHPYIFIDLALWINPKLKIEVYKWLFDHLIEYRNRSGDSYKKMSGALFMTISNKTNFEKELKDIANRIKNVCNVDDWNCANEEQLKLRNRIHENIALLADIIRDRETLYNVAIKKAIENK